MGQKILTALTRKSNDTHFYQGQTTYDGSLIRPL